MTRITAIDLVKRFKERAALDGVNFEVKAGEVFGYLGPNGAGKTTTIRLMTGLSKATSGRALVDGRELLLKPEAKRRVGVVSQTINLDQELTVAQNLDIHGRLFGMEKTLRARRSAELLELFGLADRAKDTVSRLSGGLKRRVMLARAMLHEPVALFLDEPTVGLDPDIRRSIWGCVKRVQELGASVFLTTHYIEEAEALADRVAFLHQGKIVELDTPAALVARCGEWTALDLAGRAASTFFASRREALEYAAAQPGDVTVRRATLEDAYLAVMERRKTSKAEAKTPQPRANAHGSGK